MKTNIEDQTITEQIIVAQAVRFVLDQHLREQCAADFIALQSALAECSPRGRHRAQDIRRRQGLVVASARPQPEAHGYAI